MNTKDKLSAINSRERKLEISQIKYKDSLEFAMEKQVIEDKNKAEAKYQSNILTIVSIATVLLLIGVFFIIKSLRKTRAANFLISEQKETLSLQKNNIEEKNTELLSSIAYAKRLQNAVIPSYNTLSSHFKETGLLFKPKDIVSGDFYWVHETNEYIFFAVADCTGHGVPGAIVSMIGINGLESCMEEHKLLDPAEILSQLSSIVENTFDSHGDNVQDGMDISLCRFNKKTRELAYSGANNPIWILDSENSFVLEASKRPIGKYDYDRTFSTQKIELKESQLICLFSDGMPDQFGGTKGKKLKYKAFKNLIQNNLDKTAYQNAEELSKYFEDWKGEQEQIDDVAVLLVRI